MVHDVHVSYNILYTYIVILIYIYIYMQLYRVIKLYKVIYPQSDGMLSDFQGFEIHR